MVESIAGNAGTRLAACTGALAVALALVGCGLQFPGPASQAGAVPALHVAPPSGHEAAPAAAPRPVRHADFGKVRPGGEARHIADWVVDSGDNRDAPFLIIDKTAARAYAFDRDGKLIGDAPVLLGLAKGDDTPPGIGDKPLSAIPVDQRVTGAGRYVGELGYNLRGEDVLWVDYDEGLSLHRVLTTNRKERRAHRLATPTTLDNRISYGCINVPVKFFERVVRPAYRGTKGMIYVLPETRPAQAVFGSYNVTDRARSVAQRTDRASSVAQRTDRASSVAH